MGVTYVEGLVKGPSGKQETVKFLREAHTPVILGEENDEALLGVVTLEILGLVLNPFDRSLNPMRMLLC